MLELNKVFLVGNLVQDPEVRSLTSGTAVGNFRLAVNRRYRDKNGEQREDTLFIDVECWGRLAEFSSNWLKKGTRIFVEGLLKMDTWETQDGSKRSRIKVRADRIQFADSRSSSDSGGGGYESSENRSRGQASLSEHSQSQSTGPKPEEEPPSTEDDLPF